MSAVYFDDENRFFDETCWFFDNSNQCEGGGAVFGTELIDKERVMNDDRDVFDLITMICRKLL